MAVKNGVILAVSLLMPLVTGGLAYYEAGHGSDTVAQVSHASIHINSDSDLVAQAAAESTKRSASRNPL